MSERFTYCSTQLTQVYPCHAIDLSHDVQGLRKVEDSLVSMITCTHTQSCDLVKSETTKRLHVSTKRQRARTLLTNIHYLYPNMMVDDDEDDQPGN